MDKLSTALVYQVKAGSRAVDSAPVTHLHQQVGFPRAFQTTLPEFILLKFYSSLQEQSGKR